MFKNYLIVAFRSFKRQIAYSMINVVGLAVGIACFMLIVLFIANELRYDRSHTKAERIYRICEKIDAEGQGENSSSNPFFVARALANDYPQYIEQTVRFFNFQSPAFAIQYGDKKFIEKQLFFADSNLFRVFDFKLLVGDPNSALVKPNSIVMTRAMAKKYFGEEDPMGKVVRYENFVDFQVTGILEDVPSTSHIHFEGLISYKTLYGIMGPNFERNPIWNPCWTYLLLKENTNPSELESQFPEFIKKYYPDYIKPQITHYLQPLTDIHLHSKLDYEAEPNGDAADVYIFAVVGVLILFISCINFMNLATARSASRAREVGMRKVVGAQRGHLIRQFLGESLFIAALATILAAGLTKLLMPIFNELANKNLTGIFDNPWSILLLILVGVLTGLASGLYPAFFLSAFEPIEVMKGSFKSGSTGQLLRKGLVIAQFAISIGLIIGAFIVYQQLQFMRNKDIGFTKDAVLLVSVRPTVAQKLEAFRNEILKNSRVKNVAGMNDVIGKSHNTHEFNYEGMDPDKFVYLPALQVDERFVPTMGITMVAGRNFSKEFLSDDSLGLLINQSAVTAQGWGAPENALGKQFFSRNGKERVIGVFKDFNYESLIKPIGPFILDMPPARFSQFFWRYMGIRIEGANYREVIADIESVWNRIIPEFPFEFSFLDEQLSQMYRAQDNLGKLIGYFSALAIFIACLGMFALASFTAEQRTKEIGIRKTLGASVGNIVILFSSDFLKLVAISGVAASLLSYFAMGSWLQGFAFRMEMGIGVYIAAIVTALLIALLTISYQSIKSATANPVKALKSE